MYKKWNSILTPAQETFGTTRRKQQFPEHSSLHTQDHSSVLKDKFRNEVSDKFFSGFKPERESNKPPRPVQRDDVESQQLSCVDFTSHLCSSYEQV